MNYECPLKLTTIVIVVDYVDLAIVRNHNYINYMEIPLSIINIIVKTTCYLLIFVSRINILLFSTIPMSFITSYTMLY